MGECGKDLVGDYDPSDIRSAAHAVRLDATRSCPRTNPKMELLAQPGEQTVSSLH